MPFKKKIWKLSIIQALATFLGGSTPPTKEIRPYFLKIFLNFYSLKCDFISLNKEFVEKKMEFLVDDYVYKVTYDPDYSNNEISSGKTHKTYTLLLAVVRCQHIVELRTFTSAPQI